jgi:hypothetical protein
VDDELQQLLADVKRRPAATAEQLDYLALRAGIAFPLDYIAFMTSSNGGEGDVGRAWLELWPVSRITAELESAQRIEGVVLFAGDGANIVYGFDSFRDGAIVEADWVGLGRDDLIPHGRTLAEFLRSIGGPG